jgi:hypothetical protein
LSCDSDNKGTGAFEQEGDGGHLPEDIGPESVEDPWLFKDFDVFFDGTVGALRSGSQFFDGGVPLGTSWNFIDQAGIFVDGHVLGKAGSIENMGAC